MSQDPLLRCVFIISYFTKTPLIALIMLWLRFCKTRNLRDVGLSFAHNTRVLHMIIRSYGFAIGV